MKEYLICIDSDGCAIDSMEIKHRRCFGPCMIDVWNLEAWKDEILKRWNEINLYSMTRGINRFLGLELMLREIDVTYRKIDGLEAYRLWCRTTPAFSNATIEDEVRSGNDPIFAQVLEWSRYVNHSIERLSEEIRPFAGVKHALERMQAYADIAIVSSANPQAVKDEWTRFGFMKYVTFVMTQDAGTKAECIRKMIEKGYKCDHILVLGDAPGDEYAARGNGVLYYPIIAGQEEQSWERLTQEGLPKLFEGTFSDAYQQELLTDFHKNGAVKKQP